MEKTIKWSEIDVAHLCLLRKPNPADCHCWFLVFFTYPLLSSHCWITMYVVFGLFNYFQHTNLGHCGSRRISITVEQVVEAWRRVWKPLSIQYTYLHWVGARWFELCSRKNQQVWRKILNWTDIFRNGRSAVFVIRTISSCLCRFPFFNNSFFLLYMLLDESSPRLDLRPRSPVTVLRECTIFIDFRNRVWRWE